VKPIELKTLAGFLETDSSVSSDVAVSRVTTDSRKVVSGDVFVALSGDKFDAHAFIPQVIAL
jgi:UDP-N-acetylmuramyl pentapeptide synthase